MGDLEQLRAQCRAAFEQELDDLLEWAASEGEELTLGKAERKVGQRMRRVALNVLEGIIDMAGKGYQGTSRPCACGGEMRFVNHRPKQVLPLWVTIKRQRAYYHCPSCGHGLAPLDEKIGLGASGLSEGMERILGRLGAETPFDTAVEILEEVTAGITVSPTTCQEEAEQLGAEIKAIRLAEIEQVWADEDDLEPIAPPERLYITADGTTVHTYDGWKEVKLAAIYDTEAEEAEIEPGEEADQASQITYAATFERAEGFGRRTYLEAYRRGVEKAEEVVWIGDGAPWIWNLAHTHCPQAVQIVDWFHAKDCLWTVANALFGEGTSPAQSWVEAKAKQLHDGNVKGIIYALQGYPDLDPGQQEIVRQAINYFGNNRKRMQYQDFRAKGYHIGSGVVESACKHLIAAREKQAGMRWSWEGAENIAQLRTCIRNKRYDAFWTQRSPPKRCYRRAPPSN